MSAKTLRTVVFIYVLIMAILLSIKLVEVVPTIIHHKQNTNLIIDDIESYMNR